MVWRMQDAYSRQGKLHPPTGIVDWATQVVCGYLKPAVPVDSRPMLFTVCGTGVPWWVGPDADLARAVEDRYKWQPIGYPAATFPMNPSVQAGRAELRRQLDIHRARVEAEGAVLCGYSQGAIVVSEYWMDDVIRQSHWAGKYIRAAVTFGNPMRERGRVWVDPGGPPAPATSHGIADRLMDNTPWWWRDYAHAGDLYTDCEGDSGEYKTAIYQVVMGARVLQGPDSLLAQVLELQAQPAELVALFKAIMDAGLFVARQTGPHINYSPTTAIQYLREVVF